MPLEQKTNQKPRAAVERAERYVAARQRQREEFPQQGVESSSLRLRFCDLRFRLWPCHILRSMPFL